MLTDDPPRSALVGRLRNDLGAIGFSVEALERLWGPDAAAALHRGYRVPAFLALDAVDPADRAATAAATLARLFVLNSPVPRNELEDALPSLGVEGAFALGLAEESAGDAIRPLLDLRPYGFLDSRGIGSWWIASDLGEIAVGRELREDHVLGVGGASATLSGLMIQSPVDSALDLGTGCGIQALHAARHARTVVATDISPRAIEMAGFNAALNGVDNIEFRLGNLFEPVAGELFDHIVSNPPFVITPRADGVPAYEYRDAGLAGDELVEAVMAGVGEHLTSGGIAQLLGNWEYQGDGDAFGRVRGWLDDAPVQLDAWVVEREVQDAGLYAETWIRDGGTRPGPQFDMLYRAWLADFAARRVRAVGFGYITLRRSADASVLRRFERLRGALGNNPTGLGDHIAASFAAIDWQAERNDDALLAATLTRADDVTEERHYWPGAEDPTVMTLHQGGGFARSVPLDTVLAAFVGASDGELRVDAIIAAIAQLLDADAAALAADLLPGIRDLLVTGFLHP